MTKDEFLNRLQEALTDSVPPDVVRENIQYYSDYIDGEEQKGRSEAEVLDELGNPRLIAHTIIDTTPEVSSYQGGNGSYYQGSGRDTYQNGRQSSYHSFDIDLGKWYWKLIAFIVIFAVILVVITVISGVMTLLMPVIPIVIIVGMMMLMFGGR